MIVCTRDRPQQLARCLNSLAALESTADISVLVVDNGAGETATQLLVESLGFRWVHEPVPGLDRARNRGLLESDTDIVLYTDDDVAVDPLWAATLLTCFTDPLVGAAGGLVLPAELDTPAQQAIETHAGFSRGVRRRVLDGASVSPTVAGALGAGASMAFRRELLVSLGGFPEELDAGTATRSGGDTYAFYRILRAGYRGVYEPRALARHWHRDGTGEPGATLEGYSTGTYSYLLRALIREHDPAALVAMVTWSYKWIGRRTVAAMLRRPTAPPLASCLTEIRGAIAAPRALVRAGNPSSTRTFRRHSRCGMCGPTWRRNRLRSKRHRQVSRSTGRRSRRGDGAASSWPRSPMPPESPPPETRTSTHGCRSMSRTSSPRTRRTPSLTRSNGADRSSRSGRPSCVHSNPRQRRTASCVPGTESRMVASARPLNSTSSTRCSAGCTNRVKATSNCSVRLRMITSYSVRTEPRPS